MVEWLSVVLLLAGALYVVQAILFPDNNDEE